MTRLAIFTAVLCVAAAPCVAGDIDTPSTATGTNDMFTLNEIYNYLNNVNTQKRLFDTEQTSATTSGAPGDTVWTTNEIYPLLCRVPATGQTTSVATGDDGDLEWGAALRYTFVDNDGTYTTSPPTVDSATRNIVIDDNTGLMWVRDVTELTGTGSTTYDVNGTTNLYNSGSYRNWGDSLTLINSMDYAGYNDWRMPNIKELISIANFGTFDPAIDETIFPNTASAKWWSSTVDPTSVLRRFGVNFIDGHITSELESLLYSVRPVRGGVQ